MKKKTKKNGILALIGLGALAWWKYKKTKPEEGKGLLGRLGLSKAIEKK